MKIVAGVASAIVALALTAAHAAASEHTRVVTVVNEGVLFDRTVAAPLDTDATLNVLMAAQDAARAAGASELGIVTGTTAEDGLVEVNVVTKGTAGGVQQGNNSSDVVQSGSAQSGDAIGGQVVSIVGEGSVQQTNTSTNVTTHTGASSGSNTRR
jgi:hypothetical protein